MRTYRVQVDYMSQGCDKTTVFVLTARNKNAAREAGRSLFDGWVSYNQANGYGDCSGLAVTRVGCTFIGTEEP